MSIVTKKGDSGMTGLANGKRVSKNDPRIEAVGTLDEFQSFLGLARSHCKIKEICEHVKKIQKELFLVGAEVARDSRFRGNDKNVGSGHLQQLETLISNYEPPLKDFIIPGNTKESAFFDVARTICRRLERRVVALKEADLFNNDMALKYLNRLSDLLYIFARIV